MDNVREAYYVILGREDVQEEEIAGRQKWKIEFGRIQGCV